MLRKCGGTSYYSESAGGSEKTEDDLNAAIRQIVSEAVASEGVVDVFGVAGFKKPDISILSDEFLETVKVSDHQNLQSSQEPIGPLWTAWTRNQHATQTHPA